MKKFIVLSLLLIGTIVSQAAVSTVSVAASAGYTNVPTVAGGGSTLLSISLTAPANNTCTVKVYDAPGTNITYTVGAYSSESYYATNFITTWTNFFGYTNSVTNLALIHVTNSIAASTNVYPLYYTLSCPTNSTVVFNNLNIRFNNGVYVTNSGAAGAATFTMTYIQ